MYKNFDVISNFFYFHFVDCWELRPSQNCMVGLIPNGPGTEERPKVFYFGTTSNFTWCRQQCGMEPLCYCAMLHGDPNAWHNTCYGMGYGSPMIFHTAHQALQNGARKLCWWVLQNITRILNHQIMSNFWTVSYVDKY